MSIFWNVEGKNQGQIVTEYYPQVSGAAEGQEGEAKGIRLICDASDGDWQVTREGHQIARGNRFAGEYPPNVEEAIKIKI